MRSRTRYLVLGAIAVIVAALALSPRARRWVAAPASDGPAGRGPAALPVTAAVVRPERVDNRIVSTGTVLAREEVDLKSESPGKVTRIVFTEGSHVRKGDLLVRINDAELQAELFKLESQVKLAEDRERRRRQLYEKQNISPEDYEIALNELNSIRAEIQLLRARIEKTQVRAPFDGIVGLRLVSEGSYLSPETKIASLQDISSVKVNFAVPERYARLVRAGQRIRFTVAGAQEEFGGEIYAVEPKIDPATRTVLLRAICPNAGRKILPGAFAQVTLILEEIEGALMVPAQALIPDQAGQKVYVARGGLAEERRVQIGLRTESRVQVTAGLAPFDTVLTSGILQLAPGIPVQVTEILP